MKKQKLQFLALALVLLFAFVLPAQAITTVSSYWIHPNPQLFPLGDLVTLEQIENPDDIDLGTFPDLYAITISTDNLDVDKEVQLHLSLTAANVATPIIDFYSDPFIFGEWFNFQQPYTSTMTNVQLNDFIDQQPWLSEGEGTQYIEVEDFLDEYLSGSSLVATTYNLIIEIIFSDGTPTARHQESIIVYAVTQPQLTGPMDGAEVSTLPLLMTWSWTGGPNPSTNWQMIVVETDEEEFDYDSVIENASDERIRFQGSPLSPNNHLYVGGSGTEQFLTPGKWYYWRVSVDVPTVTGGIQTANSDIRSFHYTGGGLDGMGGGSGGGRGLGGEGGETGSEGEGDLQTALTMLVEALRPIVPQSVLDAFIAELQGYSLSGISIDGVAGMTLQDIQQLLAQPGFEFISAELE